MGKKAIINMSEARQKGMTAAQARHHNRGFAAACGRCGGWTSCGGMSQESKGPLGCICGKRNAAAARRARRKG